jgi:monovalent cation/hydrogen antiporter
MRSVETVLFLVVVATVVATFARRLRVPAPSLLVVAGVLVGLVPGVTEIRVTPEIVSLIVLPPLLFAAGEELPARDLRSVWRPVAVLAVGLVAMSAAGIAALTVAITPIDTGMALVLGAVLASTDPVAVSALGRRLALPPRLQALVQAESLFNDATSLLLFRIAVSMVVAGGTVSAADTVLEFLLLAGGGTAAGVVVAIGIGLIRSRTEDAVLETVVSLVTPYLAYVLAEAVHASGVTAVVVASVILGTQATRLSSPQTRLQLTAVNGTVIFLLESVVFSLIGLQLPTLINDVAGTDSSWPFQALAISAALILIRMLWVFPLSAVVQHRGGDRPSWQAPAVVAWAGARGVVPLAAALSIPLVTDDGSPMPDRGLVQLLATAVIVISLVVQGFTLAPLVRRAGVAMTRADVRDEVMRARLRLAQAALGHLEQLANAEAAPDVLIEQLRRSWQARIDRIDTTPADTSANDSLAANYRQLRRDLLAVERNELENLFQSGAITDATRRGIQRTLDLEDAGLGDDEP